MFWARGIIICVLGVSLCMADPYGGGMGTTDDPYQIWTAEQMNMIGLQPKDWDKDFVLMADIDLSAYSNEQYNRIGTRMSLFIGTFDGKNHIISNFTYVAPTAEHVGLFGSVGPFGQIINLGLIEVTVVGKVCVGGLAGSSYRSTVTGCFVTGRISATDSSAGALVGSLSDGTISNCYTTAVDVFGRNFIG